MVFRCILLDFFFAMGQIMYDVTVASRSKVDHSCFCLIGLVLSCIMCL